MLLNNPMPTKEEKNKFYREVERVMVESAGELNWIEAITHYCEQSGLEVEVASTLINEKLRKKVEEVAVAKNYLKKSTKAKLKNI